MRAHTSQKPALKIKHIQPISDYESTESLKSPIRLQTEHTTEPLIEQAPDYLYLKTHITLKRLQQ